MSRTYVIGDIHGCFSSFRRLLDILVPVAGKDSLILLGDMINRGPSSNLVLEKLIVMQRQGFNIIALKGNHELMFLDYLACKNRNYFLINGGEKTLNSYNITSPYSNNVTKKIPPEHIHFLKSLLPYWEDETYIYVHAGMQPGVELSRQSPDWLFWAKEKFVNKQYNYGKKIIFGHTKFREPLISKNKVGIDTGAVFGGKLTCLILPDFKFISVEGLNTREQLLY